MANIIFMGTPDFSVPTLEEIHSKFGIRCVVTVPDKPQGRGLKLAFSPVKQKALELNIPILQPEKLKDEIFINQLKSYNPDIIVVVAFRILPQEVFSIPKIATFNIHASLLPKYRGAAPINHAIINGEKITGLTTFIIKEKVDTGNILLKKEIELYDGITAGELHDILMIEAPKIAIDTIELLLSGKYNALPQNEIEATPAPKIFRDFCKINWNNSAVNLRNFIHGLSPYPGAFTKICDNTVKILRVKISNHKLEPSQFIITNNNLLIGSIDNALEILEIQPENKKVMNIKDFINGWRFEKSGKIEF